MPSFGLPLATESEKPSPPANLVTGEIPSSHDILGITEGSSWNETGLIAKKPMRVPAFWWQNIEDPLIFTTIHFPLSRPTETT